MSSKINKTIFKKRVNDFFVKYFNYFVLLLVIIIFLYGSFFVLIPRYNDALRSINNLSQSENVKYNKKINDLNYLRKFTMIYGKVIAKNLDKVNNIIPNQYNKEDIFFGLQNLINNNKLKVTSIDIQHSKSKIKRDIEKKNEKKNGIGTYNVNVSVEGIDYDSLNSLLDVFERSAPLINVNNFSFSPSKSDKVQTSNFSLTTYYFIDKDINNKIDEQDKQK